MKNTLSLVVKSAIVGALLSAGAAYAQDADVAGARVPLESYLKGHATGDPAHHLKAFHPDAKISSYSDGKPVQILTVAEFASRFNGKPAADEAQRVRRIESVDVSGNAGSAKIVLDYPRVKMTDYMTLLKVDGQWKIISKTFSVEQKAKG